MRLAVIPARGGSKRIPRKNIRDFCGKPIIAWSIEAARMSGCFDRIIVSTDDQEIAKIAKEWGAEVPFERPAELSNDHTATVPVIRHAIEWFEKNGIPFDHICCIYATAPFVTSDDIKKGFEILIKNQREFTFSVTSFPFPIQRALRITETGRVEMFHPEHANTRSQDLEGAFHDAGQFYWGTFNAWQKGVHMFLANSSPVILPRHRVQDIDTHEDWIRAELMFRLLQQVSD